MCRQHNSQHHQAVLRPYPKGWAVDHRSNGSASPSSTPRRPPSNRARWPRLLPLPLPDAESLSPWWAPPATSWIEVILWRVESSGSAESYTRKTKDTAKTPMPEIATSLTTLFHVWGVSNGAVQTYENPVGNEGEGARGKKEGENGRRGRWGGQHDELRRIHAAGHGHTQVEPPEIGAEANTGWPRRQTASI